MDTDEIDEMIRAYAKYERIRDAAPELLGLVRGFVDYMNADNRGELYGRGLALLARLDG